MKDHFVAIIELKIDINIGKLSLLRSSPIKTKAPFAILPSYIPPRSMLIAHDRVQFYLFIVH